MIRYQVQLYRFGGWVLVEINSGRELFVFEDKSEAQKACLCLNGKEEQIQGQDTKKTHSRPQMRAGEGNRLPRRN